MTTYSMKKVEPSEYRYRTMNENIPVYKREYIKKNPRQNNIPDREAMQKWAKDHPLTNWGYKK